MNAPDQPRRPLAPLPEGEGGRPATFDPAPAAAPVPADAKAPEGPKATPEAGDRAREIGGRQGPEPTRYGDWEKNGIISDF